MAEMTTLEIFEPPRKQKLLDRVRDVLRVHHYSLRTEEAYTAWIRRFILHHGKRHPAEWARKAASPHVPRQECIMPIYTQVLNRPGLAVPQSRACAPLGTRLGAAESRP